MHGIADLKGLVIGVQQGNTSQPVADKLVAEHRAARVRVYAYDEIKKAHCEVSTGGCNVLMKLAPVTRMVRARPAEACGRRDRRITRESLGICVRKGNTALSDANGERTSVADGGRHAARADQAVAPARARPRRDESMSGNCRPSHEVHSMRAGFGFCADPDRQRGVRVPTGGF